MGGRFSKPSAKDAAQADQTLVAVEVSCVC
jgi:hypothetical protein